MGTRNAHVRAWRAEEKKLRQARAALDAALARHLPNPYSRATTLGRLLATLGRGLVDLQDGINVGAGDQVIAAAAREIVDGYLAEFPEELIPRLDAEDLFTLVARYELAGEVLSQQREEYYRAEIERSSLEQQRDWAMRIFAALREAEQPWPGVVTLSDGSGRLASRLQHAA